MYTAKLLPNMQEFNEISCAELSTTEPLRLPPARLRTAEVGSTPLAMGHLGGVGGPPLFSPDFGTFCVQELPSKN
jgi:hypothetical protein